MNAISEEQRKFVTQSWRPDCRRLFIDTLDELVTLSEDEEVFQDIGVVLQAMKGDSRTVNSKNLNRPHEIQGLVWSYMSSRKGVDSR